MTVTDGMDTARARVIADQLKSQGSALAGLGVQGSVLMKTLEGVWSGPDVEEFAREWQTARPAIARSSNHLTEAGHELSRQAAEQDRTSDAGGTSGPANGGAPRGNPFVTGAPSMPERPLPMLYEPDPASAWRNLTKAVREGWDVITDPIFGAVQTVVDEVVSKLEDVKKFKWLGTAAKIWGLAGGVLSYAFGQLDMVQAVWRFFTEGPSLDGALQFAEGFFGWLAGGFGIAALFAAGTIFGVPAGIVLGGLAGVCGLISIGIGLVREFGPWFVDAVESDPAWAAKASRAGGLHHGWDLPERSAPIPPLYRASDRQDALGVAAGA